MSAAAQARTWSRPPLIADSRLRWAVLGAVIAYLLLASASIDVNWARVRDGIGRAGTFIGGFLQPDFTSRGDDILQGMIESLTMTVTATVVGVLISVCLLYTSRCV